MRRVKYANAICARLDLREEGSLRIAERPKRTPGTVPVSDDWITGACEVARIGNVTEDAHRFGLSQLLD